MTASNMNDSDDLAILETATTRWLNVEEIMTILNNAQQREFSGLPGALQKQPAPPSSRPTSGDVLLYDRIAVRNYKADGHEWIRKRSNPGKVREDHVKLRFQGVFRVGGTYVHSSECDSFHRRVYRLIKSDEEKAAARNSKGSLIQELVLVHYLDTEEASRVAKKARSTSARGTKRTRAKGNMLIANAVVPPKISSYDYDSAPPKRTRTADSYSKVLESMSSHKECVPFSSCPDSITWNPVSTSRSPAMLTNDLANILPKTSSSKAEDSLDDVNFDTLLDMLNSDSALGDCLDELVADPKISRSIENIQSTAPSQTQRNVPSSLMDQEMSPVPVASHQHPNQQNDYTPPEQLWLDDVVPVEV